MSHSLVIVESPAKAKTLKRYLGSGFEVLASIGHVKDLPKNKLGVDVENRFSPEYQVITGKQKVIREIKKVSKTVDHIYLASDPDREGEAIAWHIAEEIKSLGKSVHRLLFHEITKAKILEAIQHPTELNSNRYEAQLARRVLDRLVGYQISPLLWEKVKKGLSAGRVQSVAVRIICDREREIMAFKPEEYWSLIATIMEKESKKSFEAKLMTIDGKKAVVTNEKQALAIKEETLKHPIQIKSIQKKTRKKNPAPPFITSSLQQDAYRKFRFSAKKTMMLAQKLYEGVDIGSEGTVGLITYMRTDSTRISDEAVVGVRNYIVNHLGKKFLPTKPNLYKGKKNAQDAHEAIRPTNIEFTPEYVNQFLEKDEANLYGVIWRRFVACQMTPAVYDQTTIDMLSGIYGYRAVGSILVEEGFLKIYEESTEKDGKAEGEEETKLPPVSESSILNLKKVDANQHFTQPPPRFTESSLVKELEDKGIGRPSTYHTITSTILDKEYVEKENGRFKPTELGMVVTDLLVESFPGILNVSFTAGMEGKLDDIAEGKSEWTAILDDFYSPFQENLTRAKAEMRNVKREEVATDVMCEKCQQHMVIKWGKNGQFLGCSNYPACHNTKEFKRLASGELEVVAQEFSGEDCPKCQNPLVIKKSRFGRFQACQSYPGCQFTKPLTIGVTCPEPDCNGKIVEKYSRMKKRVFYGCSNYPHCQFASWQKPVNEACPLCDASYLVERENKAEGTVIVCARKGCDYKRPTSDRAA